MNITTLSQLQFAITSVYHFFFVPLTLGLSVMLAIMETIYVKTGNPVYRRMTKFWGKLFLINFAMGVVTGIVQEFQFGMNWSEYSRYVGDIFGAPLAIEALAAFFLESVFLGVWIFGWDRIPKWLHATSIWLVAIGSNISALWILIANSFMQAPTGYTQLADGSIQMSRFADLLKNPNVWVQFPHTVLGGFTAAGFFVLGISIYHLIKKTDDEVFTRSYRLSAIFGTVAVLLVMLVGHQQAQHMIRTQPMKMAAAEALWVSEDPASFSLFTIADQKAGKDIVSIRIPYALSLLAYNRPSGVVLGINDIQADYEAKYGPGNYVPSIFISYWTFRVMVGVGMLMALVGAFCLFMIVKKKPIENWKFAKFLPFALFLPYLANSTGWILTEVGRQPWLVFGLLKTEDAVSPNLTTGMVLTSLIGFTLIYGLLMAADAYLLVKYAKAGPVHDAGVGAQSPAQDAAYLG
jgi:cytochrome d ubiquinol oxidase subunit I